jgi:hypothetical protein
VRTAPGTATGAAGAGRGAGKAAGSDKAGSSGGAVSEDEEEEEADATCRDIDDRERCGGLTIAGGDGTGKPQAPYDGVLSVVIFGASGDLASKKTFPALFGLYKRGLLPKKLAIVGAARSELSRAEFTKRVTKHVRCLSVSIFEVPLRTPHTLTLHVFIFLCSFPSLRTKSCNPSSSRGAITPSAPTTTTPASRVSPRCLTSSKTRNTPPAARRAQAATAILAPTVRP